MTTWKCGVQMNTLWRSSVSVSGATAHHAPWQVILQLSASTATLNSRRGGLPAGLTQEWRCRYNSDVIGFYRLGRTAEKLMVNGAFCDTVGALSCRQFAELSKTDSVTSSLPMTPLQNQAGGW